MSAVLIAMLPGPSRKRTPSLYRYRVTHRGPEGEPGCVVQWEVAGGRQSYQVALERDDRGRVFWHCTCADAVFRGEEEDPRHLCKHVRGLLEFSPHLARQAG